MWWAIFSAILGDAGNVVFDFIGIANSIENANNMIKEYEIYSNPRTIFVGNRTDCSEDYDYVIEQIYHINRIEFN
jgi:hypothetical protein